jgi:hypothetical protein
VSLAHCSYCGQRNAPKYAQVTWAWRNANNERVAWRQRLCPGDYAQLVLKWDSEIAPEGSLTCPGCHIDTEYDYDAVYATTFVPGFGKQSYEWPFCGACAVPVRAEAMVNAERLEDRPVGGLESAPNSDPASAVWSQLGIVPRA